MDRWKETQMDWQAGWICKMKHFVGVACTIKRPVASAGRNSFTDEMENKEEFKEVFSRLIHPAVYRQPRSTSPLQRVMNEFVVSWGGLSTDWVNVAHLGHKSKSDAGYTATCKGVVLGCTPAPSPDLWRPLHSVSETHIYFRRVAVINHNATPRASCFLWHLVFDGIKPTNKAWRFIPLSSLVGGCALNDLIIRSLLCLCTAS